MIDLSKLRKEAEECNALAPGDLPQLEAFTARELVACFTEIDRLQKEIEMLKSK